MFLFGDWTRPSACPSRVFILFEDTTRSAERAAGCNCGRALLPRRTSWAASPAKDEWPRLRAARFSVSGARPTALRRDFSLLSASQYSFFKSASK
ncbi:hypothetical protein NXC14_PA00486 (plasmid) [Rhizobium sp. NXC14]|nr:hypothetical protein NXC14_PA00486 [Rhizobium sp. NXC14]